MECAGVKRGARGRAPRAALCATVSALALSTAALANPQGGEVVGGAATITTPSPTTTQVSQQSEKAIINWKNFNIKEGESTVFVQPGASSIALNRIFDENPTVIAGLLSANGRLILINRNGMMFESGATIDTAGLIATTADITNENFLAGRYNFDIPGDPNAAITNAGAITAKAGGLVAIVAPSVENRGVIAAKLGRIELAAGSTFVLDIHGDNLVNFPISADLARKLGVKDGMDSGSVVMSSQVARAVIDDVLKVEGDSIASGISQTNGVVRLTGPGGTVTAGGTLSAGGGSVALTGLNVHATGKIDLDAPYGRGGAVDINGSNFASLTGTISANGAIGGSVDVRANNLLTAGRISADGAIGGTINLSAADRQIATTATQVSANGVAVGGTINISGGAGDGSGLFSSGSYSTASSAGAGGDVTVGGRDIKLIDAKVDVSGARGGGDIAVGFTGAGATRAINADNVLVSPTSTFKADATESGDGGSVVFWSKLATDFMGGLTAKGGALAGNGGFLEVSSQGAVGFWGVGDASAARGSAGVLTLDPKNIVVSTTGAGLPNYELIDAGSGSTTFAGNVAVLSTGNTVVTSTDDDTVVSNSGAVFVYNTTTGALVSMITGSAVDDRIGSGGITALTNGNFVFTSAAWNNVAISNAGAATFGSGVTGVSGVVSAANSLVGTATNNEVGLGGAVALTNGNYVVVSQNWDNGGTGNVGAVTWGDGTTGIVGNLTTGNSLVGSSTNDNVGSSGVRALTNGNYVVASPNYDGGFTDRGAATWGSGTTGISGTISAANSYLGEGSGDLVGSGGIVALSNGNYVVASPSWDGAGSDRGAVTWGNGATGSSGNVSTANSLFGSTDADLVGNGGVTALTNGNYVVASLNWDANGGAANDDHGAVTWRSGAAASGTAVSAANSLVGASDNDNLGSGGIRALTNGNYVVASPNYDGGFTDRGAATWGNGATGALVGTISAANSYLGEGSGDLVGSGGIVALSNGNYVVVSPSWDGAGSDRGAVTWGNGTTGSSGNVSTANSLFGSTDSDLVGNGGVVALTNGNYVVASINWDANGGAANDDHGAVTWRNGTAASGTAVSAANSLVGSSDNDNVGSGGTTALTNGNYVVASPNWDNGGTANVGAVTWGNGAAATTIGAVSAVNSLIGSTVTDQVGSGGVLTMASGDYVVSSPLWNNGATTDTGAVTLGVGTGGTVGALGLANSMAGASGAQISAVRVTTNNEIIARSTVQGTALVGLTDPAQVTFARAQAATLTVHPAFLTRTLNTGTAVTLQASNDLTISSDILVNNPGGDGGALTLQAGRSVLINADITTDNGDLTIIANELLAAGVVNAQRDAGNAVLTMGAGADIDAGTGDVRLTIASGAGKTNTASGDMTLRNVTAGTLIAENLGPSNGNVVIASGALTAGGAGTPLVVASQGGNFINNAGAGALSTTAGGARWIVYSQNPAANTLGGLAGSPYYNTIYNAGNPTGLAATGNRFAYSVAPVLNVTADSMSRAYGAANPPLTHAITGFIGGDNPVLAVSGAPTLSTTATATSSVLGGPYAITTALGTLASDYNYGFALVDGLLTVNPAALTVTADDASKTYGQTITFAGTEFTALGLQNGESVGTATLTSAGSVATAGVAGSPYAIVASNLTGGTFDPTNYAISYVNGALTVNPAALTITADDASKIYGQTLNFAGTEFTSLGLQNGETVGSVSLASAGAAPTAGVAGSPYAIAASNAVGGTFDAANYAISYVGGLLTVNPAALTVTADDLIKTYGQNPTFAGTEFTSLGLQNGETIGSVTLASAGAAGTANVAGSPYAIAASNATGGTFDAANYAISYVGGLLTVNPASLTVTADDLIKSYGQAVTFAGTEFTSLGLQNGETIGSVTLASAGAAATANVAGSPYAIAASIATGGTFDAANYAISYVGGLLTVNPAALTITADDLIKTYGQTVTFAGTEFTALGLQNSETVGTVTLASAGSVATAGVAGSPYAIVASNLTGGTFDTANYAISYVDGALTVNPAALTITADNASKIYGQTITFAGTEFTPLGLQNGETVGSVSLASAGAAPMAGVTGSPYAIAASNATGGTFDVANYAISYVDGALTVNPAALTITADDASKNYGQTLTFAGTEFATLGLQNGESVGSLSLASAGAAPTAAVAGSPYAITASNATGGTFDAANYAISYVGGLLIVNPAALTITADDLIKSYGQSIAFAGSEFTALGLQNGETIGSVQLASAGTAATANVAGSPYAITASNASGGTFDAANYLISYAGGLLTVNQTALTITADDLIKTYGQTVTFAGTEFTALGLQNGETVGTASLASAGSAASAGVAGSPYAIVASTLTGGTFDAANYAISYVDGALTVNPATLTITADDASKIYGQTVTFAGTEFTALGLQNGETVGTATLNSAGSIATAGVAGSPYAIVASNLTGGTFAAANYAISYVDGALTVNPAALTITADDASKIYGQTLTFAGSEFTSLGLQNGETVGSVTLASAGAAPTAGVAGSPYAITASNATGGTFDAANYAISYVGGLLTVNAAALTVTADDLIKTYGQTLTFAGTEFTALGLQNGETIGSVTLASAGATATANVAGSPYAIAASNATGGTFDAANYLISYAGGLLTVNPAALTVTADDLIKTYGQTVTFAGTEFTALGLQNGETVGTVTLASAGSTATAGVAGSPYAIVASNLTGGTFDAANYAISYVDGALTVNPAALTITADNASKIYGQTVTFGGSEFTSLGLQNGETVGSVTLNSAGSIATAGVAGSPYAITASNAASGTFDAANYAISYVDGALTVNPAALTITADDLTKTYGQTATFAGTEFTSLGLQNGETVGSVTLASAGAAPTAGVAGSPYAIAASNATGGTFDAANYAITYVGGLLSVNPAALAVTADDLIKTYGQTLTFAGSEFTALGLQNGETIGSVQLASAGAAATANVAGSPYAIAASNATGGTFDAANYAISYVGGLLSVNPAALTVTADDLIKTYGQAVTFAGTEFTALGLQNGETAGTVTLASAGSLATAGVAGSPYAIVASNLTGGTFEAANYAISYVDGALSVNPAALTVTADDASKIYGQTISFAGTEFTALGLENGETAGTVTLASGGAAPTASVAGSPYAIVASNLIGGTFDAANYAISYVNGALTVNPAALTITADDATKTYGQTLNLTGTEFTSLGLQNGETIGAVTLASAGAAPTAGVAGSPYAITASNAAGGTFDAANYAITYAGGLLTVNPAALTISADDLIKTYGQTVTFAGSEFTTLGLQNGETIGSVALASVGAPATANVAGSPYAITASNAAGGTFDAANYVIAYADGSLTVNPAALTITPDDSTKTYGQTVSFAGNEFTALGLQNGETVGTVALNSAGSIATAGVAGSPYAIVASNLIGGTFDAANYAIAYVDGALTVNPAALTVTADDAGKTYGQTIAFAGSEFTALGLQNGETVGTATLTSAGSAATAGVAGSPYAIVASNLAGGTFDAANYAISYVDGALTVNPASLTITAADGAKTYGQTLTFAGTEFSALGLQNGETVGGVTLASTGAAATAGVAGSPYAIVASNAAGGTFDAANYAISYVDGALTVNPAGLTITADDLIKTYGQTVTFAGTEFTALGLQNGETIGAVALASAGAAATANVAGSPHAITASSATGGTFDAANYLISYVGGLLTVNPAALTITADDSTKTYGQTVTFAGAEFAALGLQNGETVGTVALASAGSAATAGVAGSPYAITASNATGGTFDAANYAVSYVDGALTVNPAALTVTADDASKTYGQTITFAGTEFTALGLQNGESVGTATLTSAGSVATAGVAGSPYAIVASNLAGGTFDAANYAIAYVDGALTVNPAALTITADDASKIYGQALTFAGTEFTSLGLQNGETVGGVTLASAGAAPTAGVAGSPYAIVASNATGGTFAAANYAISYIDGALTVSPAALTITADNLSKTYGQTLTFGGSEFTSLGLQNGETVGSVTLASAGAINTAGVAGSPYAITAANATGGTFNAANYLIAYNDGLLTVNPATLTYVADPISRLYGDANPALTGSVTGFVAGDTLIGATTGALAFTTLATANDNVGSYAITGSALSAANYVFVQAAGNAGALMINPSTLTYVADPASRLFGTANPAFTGAVAGFKNGETILTATSGTLVFASPATLLSPAGTYAIDGSGLAANSGNYVFVQDPSNAAALTVIADPNAFPVTTMLQALNEGDVAGEGVLEPMEEGASSAKPNAISVKGVGQLSESQGDAKISAATTKACILGTNAQRGPCEKRAAR